MIITDSRGKTLDRYFSGDMLSYVDIRPFNGLSLHELNINLQHHRFIQRASLVYIMVGINDFTILDRPTHTVRLITPFPYILCPIYGMDINAYNKVEGTYRYQDALDQAAVRTNDFIGKLNARNQLRNPFISNVVHRYRPKTGLYITMYKKLWDCLHPSMATQEKIAKYLQRSIAKHREVL